MEYMIIIRNVEFESNSLQELVDFAVSTGECPSTEIWRNGKIMSERLIDFMQF
jgi:hypothetical protein